MKNSNLKKAAFLLLFGVVLGVSCKKNDVDVSTEQKQFDQGSKQMLKTTFSKTLAIAIQKEPTLRLFLKTEALKQFDMDNDVLFELAKDVKLENGKTFYETIAQYASSKTDLDQAISGLPTLTILVPEVPNFNAEIWNTTNEIPIVAVAPENKKFRYISLYDADGKESKIPFGRIPGFPVVVVKENERVKIANNLSVNNDFVNTSGKKFIFLSKNFDGSLIRSSKLPMNSESSNMKSDPLNKLMRFVDLPLQPSNPNPKLDISLDQRNIDAFNRNVEWHRDYVYYGLDPNAGTVKGKFNNRYVEHIVALKVTRPLSQLSDSPEDPNAVDSYQYGGSQWPTPVIWTDGYFEIRVNILINGKGGAGSNLEKSFSLKGSELYDVKYTRDGTSVNWYKASVTPKDCILNEPIVAWDFENYGSQWKFIVTEFDNSSTNTLSLSNSTKYASNFQFDIGFGDKVKVGTKFGSSIETTETSSYQVVTTTGSEVLGEGILEFSSPIILRKEFYLFTPSRGTPYNRERYVINEVTGGSFTLTVEPRYR